MSNSNGYYDFTAQIMDADTNRCVIPDYECELACSWYRGELCVDYVFINIDGHRENLSLSTDPFPQKLCAKIVAQAEDDDALIAEVYNDFHEAA